MLILNEVKVVCFDTLLQVLILKVVSRELDGPLFSRENEHALALRRVTKSRLSNLGEVLEIRGVLLYRANIQESVQNCR